MSEKELNELKDGLDVLCSNVGTFNIQDHREEINELKVHNQKEHQSFADNICDNLKEISKLESVLKGWRLKLLNDKDSKPDSDILYTCKNCGNEIDQIEFEVQKLSISISREDWDYTCGLALLGIDDESESEREELEKLTKIMKEVEKL